jgi:hypothetical protein
MNTLEILKTVDFTVYKKVLRGINYPGIINKIGNKSSLNLVRCANTYVVCSGENKDKTEQNCNTIDLRAYGYHSYEDFELSFKLDNKLKVHQAIVIPNSVYPLCEDISLPDPPDEKEKIFLDFFADEFERIKIRAEHALHSAYSSKKIQTFACCNLQLLRKLLHDSQIAFNKMCSDNQVRYNQCDLYIMYILNLFIIRAIVFYTDFFKPYLTEDPLDEQSLRTAFQNEMPHKPKYPWLFIHHPIIYEIITDYNCTSQTLEDIPVYLKSSVPEKFDITDDLLKELLELIELKGCIQLNCNKNVFLAEIFKMLYEKKYDGKGMVSTEKNKLIKLLSFIITDDEGNPLNPATIKTVIKPSSIKKRPGIPYRD